jgi:prepilin-type N-terminal cleavage/methylation domain-containing protein
MKYLRNTSGFTLVEMVIAMTIFAVMSVAIISTYLQSTAMSYRLKAGRYLSETAREITERIAEDVREKGISLKTVDPTNFYPLWNNIDYTGL